MASPRASFTPGWMDILGGRQRMYCFLARVFQKEVDQQFLMDMAEFINANAENEPKLQSGINLVNQWINSTDEGRMVELASDYARIFLGMGSRQAGNAFPFESVYTSPRGLLMQEARNQVVECYRQAGLQVDRDDHTPEDHIGYELALMAALCEQAMQAVDADNKNDLWQNLEMQQRFISHHLLNWVPRFCQDMQRCAEADFYRGMAVILDSFIEIDAFWLMDYLGIKVES